MPRGKKKTPTAPVELPPITAADRDNLPRIAAMFQSIQRDRVGLERTLATRGHPDAHAEAILGQFRDLEQATVAYVTAHCEVSPIYPWLSSVKGIGPRLAGMLVGLIDIRKAQTVSALWRFCFPAGQRVATDVGQVPIEHLQLTHRVYGHDGALHAISALRVREYDGPLLTIQARKMLPIRCTPNHPILTASVTGPHGARRAAIAGWKEAGHLAIGDWVVMPVPTATAVGEEPDPTLAYFYGRFVGDGSTAFYREARDGRTYERGHSRITFGLSEQAEAELAMVYARRFGEAKLVRDARAVHLQFGRTGIAREWRRRFGFGAADKRIPPEIMQARDPKVIREFLRGYFDADGCRITRRPGGERAAWYTANTRSEGLALQLQALMARLGGGASVTRAQVPEDGGMIAGRPIRSSPWRWVVNLAAGDAPRVFDEPNPGNRRAPLYVEGAGFFAVPVVGVASEHFAGPVYDLSADGSFTVHNVAVHNSGLGVVCGFVIAPRRRAMKKGDVEGADAVEAVRGKECRLPFGPDGKCTVHGDAPGISEQRRKGVKLSFNIKLKKTCFLIARSFIMLRVEPYNGIYEEAKVYYVTNRPTWDKGRQDLAARRKMVKVFLAHLWKAWREAEGLPVGEPYILAKGKDAQGIPHSHYIPPAS